MTEHVLTYLSGLPQELVVLILSMMPVIELRGALPIALEVYDMSLLKSFILVLLGNMVPGVIILYFWDWIINEVNKYWPWLRNKLKKIEEKTEGKSKEKIQKYGSLALILFVAVPLPGSGVWTGALAAWLMNIEKKRALGAIFLGVLIAATAVAILTKSISTIV